MHPPERRALEAMRNWLEQPLPVLGGRSKHFLEDETDLVSLKVPAEADFLSKRLRAYWPGQVEYSPASHLSHSDTIKDEPSRDGLHRIRRYNEKSITVAVGLISIALAAALLIGAIVGFSYVSRWSAKVGMICAFTIAFALCVGLTTNAKRGEIFAGTAA